MVDVQEKLVENKTGTFVPTPIQGDTYLVPDKWCPMAGNMFFKENERAIAKPWSSRSVLGQKRVGRSTKETNTQFGLTWLANTTFHPFLAVHRPGRPHSRYFGQLPPGFGHILLHFVALHQSIRSDQPGVEQLHFLSARDKKQKVRKPRLAAAQQQLIALKIRVYSGVIFTPVGHQKNNSIR